MLASCERSAGAGCQGGKLSRVRSSQPLGSVMSGRRERSGQINEGSEVKDVCSESDPKPREMFILGAGRTFHYGRRPCRRRANDERRKPPRGRRQHRATQRQASNQASDEQGLLGKCAMQYPSMCINIKRDAQMAASRVMGIGRPQRLAMRRGNARGAKVPTVGRP